MFRSSLRRVGVAIISSVLVAGAGVTTAQAATARPAIPEKYQLASIVSGSAPVAKLAKADFIAGAQRVGQPLTSGQKSQLLAAAATSCWSWDAWRSGKSAVGITLWKSHHNVNWCGDGSWIRNHAYTDRWGETFAPGWNFQGIEQQGQRYGVNWNQYNSWTQMKFCFVSYFSCIQEAHPYTNTTVFPNGAGQYN